MKWFRSGLFLLHIAFFAAVAVGTSKAAGSPQRSENVILVMCDGLRCEEVFTGVDPDLINKERGDIDKTDAVQLGEPGADGRKRLAEAGLQLVPLGGELQVGSV